MSNMFCEDYELAGLERLMSQPPNYRPRGHGLYVKDVMEFKRYEIYSELLDFMADRMQAALVKNRIQEFIMAGNKEMVFKDERHRKDFYSLLSGKIERTVCGYPNYGAAVFLLSADEALWNRVKAVVSDDGILFRRVKLGGVTLEQYILFHAAKGFYTGTEHISLSELADRELVNSEMFRLVVNAMLIVRYGIHIVRWEE